MRSNMNMFKIMVTLCICTFVFAADAVDGLRIYINSDAPLEPLKLFLSGERIGRGRVEIIPRLPGYKSITLELKDKYYISTSVYQAVVSIPGVLDVQEI